MGNVFPSDGLWIGLVTYLNCGVCHLFYLYRLVEKGMAYGGLPFPGTGGPVPNVANIHFLWNV